MVRLDSFGTRLALGLVIMGLVLLAHGRHELQVLQAVASAALFLGVVLGIRHAYRTRRASKT